MKSVKTLILAGLLSLAAAPAYAHFMMVYTPELPSPKPATWTSACLTHPPKPATPWTWAG